jgi:heme oxygenase
VRARDDGAGATTGSRAWLRHATARAHARAEASLALLDADLTTESYADALAALHALHAGLEPQLAAAVADGRIAPRLVGPARTPDLERDLAALGRRPNGSAGRVLRLSDADEALAGAYVLGGSTLGATVLVRSVPTAVSGGARRFLERGASPEARACWRAVSREIERCGPHRLQRVAATANLVFDVLSTRMEVSAVRS